MSAKIETIASDNNLCGEGPLWDANLDRLLWVDAESALIFGFSPADSSRTVISRALTVSGIALNSDNTLIVGGAGLHLWRGQNDYDPVLREHDGEALFFNDIIADARGRVYAGTYYWGEDGMEKPGKLYLVDRDGSARVMDEGIALSNGLGFSPDNGTLYYADSAAGCIYTYDVDADTGRLSNRRIFVTVPREEGIPDGLTVDADGYVWNAHWYGGQVARYDPDGNVERRVRMPAKQVSSVAFGGRELTDLYVTSAGRYWPGELVPAGFDCKAPMGGPLYRIRLEVQGKREHAAGFGTSFRSTGDMA